MKINVNWSALPNWRRNVLPLKRKHHQKQKITIDDLAYELELTSGFVELIEGGKRGATLFTLYKISELFGISIGNIFARASERLSERADEPEQPHREMLKNKILLSFNYLKDNELEFLVRTIKGIKNEPSARC